MPSNRSVQYVDFGYSTARQYWEEAGLAAYQRFTEQGSRQTAIDACSHAWHIHEWLWHELHPGEDTQGNPPFLVFRKDLIDECEELAWVRDVSNAAKHRGLGRPGEVSAVNNRREGILAGHSLNGRPYGVTIGVSIDLTDGTRLDLGGVLSTVIKFWNGRFGVTI